jgi:PEP-CTERM motif-containing protein
MSWWVPLRRWLLGGLFLLIFTSAPATALPLDYIIFDADTLLDLGTFTVDPALASPSGTSSVEVSAFSITETVGSYGPLTATLAERITLSGPFARFVDGQITSFSSNTQYQLPGDIGVNVDIVPTVVPGEPDIVAVFQMFAVTLPNLTNMQVASSRGIGIKSVPEPSTMLLMGTGAVAALIRRRRPRASTQG